MFEKRSNKNKENSLKRKLVAGGLATTVAFGMAACGEKDGSEAPEKQTTVSQTETESTDEADVDSELSLVNPRLRNNQNYDKYSRPEDKESHILPYGEWDGRPVPEIIDAVRVDPEEMDKRPLEAVRQDLTDYINFMTATAMPHMGNETNIPEGEYEELGLTIEADTENDTPTTIDYKRQIVDLLRQPSHAIATLKPEDTENIAINISAFLLKDGAVTKERNIFDELYEGESDVVKCSDFVDVNETGMGAERQLSYTATGCTGGDGAETINFEARQHGLKSGKSIWIAERAN